MEAREFYYDVSIRLVFTREEVEHLVAQARTHYDFDCQNAARPCREGFLNGLKNHVDWGDAAELYATPDQIDTMLKILEQPGSDMTIVLSLRRAFARVIGEWHRLEAEKEKKA